MDDEKGDRKKIRHQARTKMSDEKDSPLPPANYCRSRVTIEKVKSGKNATHTIHIRRETNGSSRSQ